MDVGFIGLGNMGRQIVDAQLDAGLPMTMWARREASLDPYADTGARFVGSPAEVGVASDVVGICVWDEADVDEILLGDDGVFAGLRRGAVVAIHSTISPAACKRLEDVASSFGCGLVDAPVSVGATFPKLLVMVGGHADAVARCRPALEVFGDPVVHLGPIGSGQIAKLMNNTLLAAQIGVADSAVELGSDLGLDREALVSVLSAGSARGTWSAFVHGRPAAGLGEGRTQEWARKDVGLAVDLASQRGIASERTILEIGALGADVVEGNGSR
jgi:3-hydroxyisobutyrate dehydrogenase